MPNHCHVIIEIVGAPLVGALSCGQPNQDNQTRTSKSGQPQGIAPTVGDIVGAFKSMTTNEYIRGVKNTNWRRFDKKLWQRNYWEHIIRDENEYHQLSDYIKNNPASWNDDTLNSAYS